MALGSPQPLSTSEYQELKTLPISSADCLEILGSSNFWSPKGVSRPPQGKLYFYSFQLKVLGCKKSGTFLHYEGIPTTETSVTINISTQRNTPENLNRCEKHTPRVACLFTWIHHISHVLPNLTLRKYFVEPGRALRKKTTSSLCVCLRLCMLEHV
jgi:hypothetical protein